MTAAELIERLPRLDESRVDADRGPVLTVQGAHRELICADLGLQRLHLRPRSIRLFEQRIERAVLAKDRRRLRVGDIVISGALHTHRGVQVQLSH